jgi:MFS family permease
MKQSRTLWIVALIALVNMLGYGIIIPLLYGYSKKFGLSDFENGLLFAIYSVCQFFATPIIGRWSDKYGRRPMLLLSIIGTALSFFVMAFAPNAAFLFIARAVDGLTAGNIPVVFAVISDSTKPEERAGAFGFIGSAFNFGFVFGPAIAALTIAIHPALPFILAGGVTIIAAALTALYLPETNMHMGEVKQQKLFDFPGMFRALFDPAVGATLLISFVFFLAFACSLIYGFQPFTLNVLHITEAQNALLFTLFGAVGLIAQTFLVAPISKVLGMKKAFSSGIVGTALAFIVMFFSHSVWMFAIAIIILSLVNNVVQTLIPTILSQEVDQKSQGTMMGINASYQSLGMILGPLLGGAVAAISIASTFLVGAVLVFSCLFFSFRVLKKSPVTA